MKPSLAIKTLFRTPGKTIFTFLLIAVLTFSLFIQLAEYVKTAEEFHAAVESYTGTGYVEYRPAVYKGRKLKGAGYLATDPRLSGFVKVEDGIDYPSLSTETVAELEAQPYVSSVYKRYMTAGVSDKYMRMMEDLIRYDYNNRVVVEGTLYFGGYGQSGEINGKAWQECYYTLSDAKVLAGDVRLEDLEFDYAKGRYIQFKAVALDNVFTYDGRTPISTFKDGERYVVICSFQRHQVNVDYMNITRQSLMPDDMFSEHDCPAFWNITDAPENYLELPEYAPLKTLISILETDLYTFDVVYADDMTAIRKVHGETLKVKEGRWLTPEDTANNAKACVIDSVLAQQYGLKLGDKLSLRLGDALFEQFYTLGAIARVPERLADKWTQEEFEIVGIYGGGNLMTNGDEPNWSYSYNTVFVPLSSLPESVDLTNHEYAPGEFTFRVDNAWDIGPFLAETAPKIEAMGLTLDFDDGGWMEVLEGYREAQRLPLIRIVLLAFVTVTGLALSVYLFVSRKKKDYAIMRALGTPKRRSGRALLLPITVLSLAAVLLAVCAGMIYSSLALGSISPMLAAICIGGEMLCTLAFAAFNIQRLSRLSPLELLQGGKAQKKHPAAQTAQTIPAVATAAPKSLDRMQKQEATNHERPHTAKDPATARFVLRYVRRHIRRQGLKSALALLLAVLMVGAVAQFAGLRDTYQSLRETTPVKVQFTNSLSIGKLQTLADAGLTKDAYYERNANISCLVGTVHEKTPAVITSDLDRFLNQNYEVTLGKGYTEEDIGKLDHVLLGEGLMAQRDLRPGDVVRLATASEFDAVFQWYQSAYLYYNCWTRGLEPDVFPTEEQLLEHYGEEIQASLDMASVRAVVIGSIKTENGTYQDSLFTAGLDSMTSLVGTYQTMPLIEFTLADNSRLAELKQQGEELTNGRKGALVIDSAALESVIRTSDLLNGLYPAIIALALLIGAAMCALLVLQSGREAAIMRALGTTKRSTRSMLATEQILLGICGALFGLGIMLAWKRAAFMPIALQAGLFAVGYVLALVLASYLSAAIATRKNILELLQTKE